MRIIIFILLLTIGGCTYSSQSEDERTPKTYQRTQYREASSIGHLRRLALMPIQIEKYEGKNTYEENPEIELLKYEHFCAQYLTVTKGYQIEVVRVSEDKWKNTVLEKLDLPNVQELYKKWNEEEADSHTKIIIQQIGGTLKVDGILVIRISEHMLWNPVLSLLNVFLMNIPLFYTMMEPNIGAWIYETASGELVWYKKFSDFVDEVATTEAHLQRLFWDLDNAVPQQSTR